MFSEKPNGCIRGTSVGGLYNAAWSSSVARWSHTPEVMGSNPIAAISNKIKVGETSGDI